MTEDPAPTSRQRHIVRLAVFAVFLLVLFYLLAVKHVVNIEDVRRWVKATGPLAPFAYIVLSAVLGAIFVPLPIATDDHQTKNAAVMVGVGAARIIQERDLTPELLGGIIAELCADRAALLKMAQAARAARITDAATRLADLCIAAGAPA